MNDTPEQVLRLSPEQLNALNGLAQALDKPLTLVPHEKNDPPDAQIKMINWFYVYPQYWGDYCFFLDERTITGPRERPSPYADATR